MKIFKIDLDMIRQTKGYYIELAEDDYGSSVLEITLQKEGQVYDLTGVTAIEIPFKTPRGTIYVHDLDNGVEITDAAAGKITCTISTQALGDAGRVFFDVRIFKGLTLATSTPMTLYVRRPIINNSSITDMDQYPVLQTLIIQCQAITDEEAVRVAQETAREIAEGLRVQGEANRNTAYTTAETARDGSYGAKEEERDGKYALAETTRNGLYEGKETDRDNAYNLKEVERDGEYDLAETARNNLYTTAENAREGKYGLAESGRSDSYADAEDARDVLYGNAEAGRQSAYGDAESARDNLFADAEVTRNAKVNELTSHDITTGKKASPIIGHTKQVTGYGSVAVPNNAKGQVSVSVKGNTITNKAGAGDTSPQTITLDNTKTYLLIKTDGGTVNVDTVDTAVPVKLTALASTTLTWTTGKIGLYEIPTAEAGQSAADLAKKYTYVDSTKSTFSGLRGTSVGKNLVNIAKLSPGRIDPAGGAYANVDNNTISIDNLKITITSKATYRGFVTDFIGVKPNAFYKVSYSLITGNAENPYAAYHFCYDRNKNYIGYVTTSAATLPGTVFIRSSILNTAITTSVISNLQIEEGTAATPYEPYMNSKTYISGFDKDGNPIILRSVPNGTKDEFSDGVITKNVSVPVILDGNLSWGAIDSLENTYRSYNNSVLTHPTMNSTNTIETNADAPYNITVAVSQDDRILCHREDLNKWYVRVEKTKIDAMPGETTLNKFKAYMNAYPITVIYQLAEPVVTPIDVVGDLVAYPNGTIYWEPCISGYMTESSKTATTAEYPITEIRKMIRYDYTPNGNLLETDVTADVSVDVTKTTLTIANFVPGKTYFYDCAYPQELTTTPEIVADVEVENGMISKDFQAAATAWTLTANEAKASVLTCTNAGGAASIIAPARDGKKYIIKNLSGQNITIKTATSTGVVVANGKKVTVFYNGTDFEKIAEV